MMTKEKNGRADVARHEEAARLRLLISEETEVLCQLRAQVRNHQTTLLTSSLFVPSNSGY